MIFEAVPGERINSVWLQVLPLVKRLVAEIPDRATELSIYETLMRGEAMLWLAVEDGVVLAFITTKTVVYPKLKMLSFEMCSGDGAEVWFPEFEKHLETYARDTGHDGLEMVGRKGWVRKFGLGWNDKYSFAEKRFK